MPGREALPSTLKRSSKKAQRTWVKAHDSAVDSYGEGERSHRVAFAALKHTHEKVGDHWEAKDHKGRSDERDNTAGGVDTNATKQHLYEQAKKLGVPGRSRMTKDELVEALQKANDRETARAR
ncbi:ChaB family protein [Allokutzneria sp. NRRL B-24872]|uniref:ChaB family protein n=1 Tax=Allokutzneria sp. NRRL B-24872 TaxID=1137961 RepID=UPI000A3D149A|nr:ChaB family protein [Allokutzneria sp. NRRL B-24872]